MMARQFSRILSTFLVAGAVAALPPVGRCASPADNHFAATIVLDPWQRRDPTPPLVILSPPAAPASQAKPTKAAADDDALDVAVALRESLRSKTPPPSPRPAPGASAPRALVILGLSQPKPRPADYQLQVPSPVALRFVPEAVPQQLAGTTAAMPVSTPLPVLRIADLDLACQSVPRINAPAPAPQIEIPLARVEAPSPCLPEASAAAAIPRSFAVEPSLPEATPSLADATPSRLAEGGESPTEPPAPSPQDVCAVELKPALEQVDIQPEVAATIPITVGSQSSLVLTDVGKPAEPAAAAVPELAELPQEPEPVAPTALPTLAALSDPVPAATTPELVTPEAASDEELTQLKAREAKILDDLHFAATQPVRKPAPAEAVWVAQAPSPVSTPEPTSQSPASPPESSPATLTASSPATSTVASPATSTVASPATSTVASPVETPTAAPATAAPAPQPNAQLAESRPSSPPKPQPPVAPAVEYLPQVTDAEVAPQQPPTIHYADNSQWPLSLMEAVQVGVANSKDVTVLGYSPQIADTNISVECSFFDPVFGMNGYGGRNFHQVRSAVEAQGNNITAQRTDSLQPIGAPDEIYLRRNLTTGGELKVGAATDYTNFFPPGDFLLLNPGWNSNANVRYRQPLGAGRGRDVATIPLRVARSTAAQSRQEFAMEVRRVVLEIETAFWSLSSAQRQLELAEYYYKLAERTEQDEIERERLGSSSLPNVLIARAQREQFGVQLTQAQQQAAVAADQLRQVMGLRTAGADGAGFDLLSPDMARRQIMPTILPQDVDVDLEWPAAVQTALARPEIAAQRSAVRTANLIVYQARNSLLPNVSLQADYAMQGLENRLDKSIGTAASNQFQLWGVGLYYERPLGMRSANAQLRRAALSASQQQAQLRKLEHDIIHALRQTYETVRTTNRAWMQQQQRLSTLKEQHAAFEELYRQGRIELFRLLDAELNLSSAELSTNNAWLDARIAEARWRYEKFEDTMFYNLDVAD